MEPTYAINDLNKALYKILRTQIDPNIKIIFGSPADEEASFDTSPKLYVFLFSIVENPHQKNAPRTIISGEPSTFQNPPLPLNLIYMLIPSSQAASATGEEPPDGVGSHLILAQAMIALNDNGIIESKFFPEDSSLIGSDLRIQRYSISIDDISKIWSTFQKPFQLSICYEISVIRLLSSKTSSTKVHQVTKPKVNQVPVYEDEINGIPIHEKVILHYAPSRKISGIKPSRVQAGMAVNVVGRDLRGRQISIKLDEQELDKNFFVSINENLIKVKVPLGTAPGKKQLTIKIDADEIYSEFEVVPSSVLSPSITEIRPPSGKSGDIICILGNNFDEDLEITVGDHLITTRTFVDRNQINILIPSDLTTGTTKISINKNNDISSQKFEII